MNATKRKADEVDSKEAVEPKKTKTTQTSKRSKVVSKGNGSDRRPKEQDNGLKHIRDALAEKKASALSDMMKGGTLIRLLATDSFYTALATLRDTKILSAPVYDEVEGRYVGFIDIIDLAAATLEILEANENFNERKKGFEGKARGEQDVSEEEADEGENELLPEHLLMDSLSVKAVSDFSHRDPFLTINESESLLKLADQLKRHHRLAIVDKDDKVTGVATQSGLMEFISEEYFEAIENSGRRVKDLHLPHNVYSVTADSTALQALEVMKDRKVSGLAVLSAGKVVDVVSASDLMLWSEWMTGGHVLRFKHLQALETNVIDFLKESRASKGPELPVDLTDTPLVCNRKTLLSDALSTMLLNNVHRLIVVDKISHHPISVLTYGDLITEILKK